MDRLRKPVWLSAGALALAVLACGDDPSTTAGWTGTIDTLASGTILVRNPEGSGGEIGNKEPGDLHRLPDELALYCRKHVLVLMDLHQNLLDRFRIFVRHGCLRKNEQ